MRGDYHREFAEEAVAGRWLREQRLHFAPELRVALARGIEKDVALPSVPLPRGVIERLDA